MSKVLVIGCGGVASVAIQKCCQVSDVFTEILIASRTKSKCDALAEKLKGKTNTHITTAHVDADSVDELTALIKSFKPDLVMNVALPYQDLTIMDAWLAASTTWIRPITNRNIQMTRNGVPFMKNGANRMAFRHISITAGNGLIKTALKMPASWPF